MVWPAATTSRPRAGRRSTLTPHWKKVAGTLWRARISRSWGVLSLGPSSKVRAMAGRAGSPRQREGPKTAEERPRTAQARREPAARAPALPIGKGSMRIHCSEGGDGRPDALGCAVHQSEPRPLERMRHPHSEIKRSLTVAALSPQPASVVEYTMSQINLGGPMPDGTRAHDLFVDASQFVCAAGASLSKGLFTNLLGKLCLTRTSLVMLPYEGVVLEVVQKLAEHLQSAILEPYAEVAGKLAQLGLYAKPAEVLDKVL